MENSSHIQTLLRPKTSWVIVLFFLGLITWMNYRFPIKGMDWSMAFQPAAFELLHGHNPYLVENFFNAPWALLPLLPLALLPVTAAMAVLTTMNLASLIVVAYKMKAGPFALAALLLSPSTFRFILDPNIDYLVALGFILPPWLGLFFVLAKPQLGIGIAVYWLIDAFRVGGWRRAFKTFAPVTAAFLLSFLIFGLWPLQSTGSTGPFGNANNLWPWSIPIGIVLLLVAIIFRRKGLSILSSPFFAPYIGSHSFAVPLLGLLPNQLGIVIAVVALWIHRLL